MRISSDLRNLIDRKLREMESEERIKVKKERDAICNELTEKFHETDEYKAYIAAFKAVKKAFNEYAEELKPLTIHQNYGIDRPAAFDFHTDEADIYYKYQNIRDGILLKLSYGESLDECTKILAEFGINI